jgi:hypothetical protein
MKKFETNEFRNFVSRPYHKAYIESQFKLNIEIYLEGMPLSFEKFECSFFSMSFDYEKAERAVLIIYNCTREDITKAIPCISLLNMKSFDESNEEPFVGITLFNYNDSNIPTTRELIFDRLNLTFRIILKESKATSECLEAWIKNEI